MKPEEIGAALHQNGLRNTAKRRAVAGLLLASGKAVTPAEVWQKLRPKLGRLGLPSVYRILEDLTRAGLLTRIRLGRGLEYAACRVQHDERLLGRVAAGHHHHLVCVGCGRVEPIACSFPPSQVRRIRRRTGFRVTGHTFQVEGQCPDCLADERN